jgi:hypothetical protein
MKTFTPYDVIFGVNDTSHFVHTANDRQNEEITLAEFFRQTEGKRKWSIVNPGFILSKAYSYFVFAYEREMLDDFEPTDLITKIKFTDQRQEYNSSSERDKCKQLRRRLRNSIAHCKYIIECRTADGRISKDDDLWFVFEDNNNHRDDHIKIEVSYPVFANLVEGAGKHCMRELKIQQS